MKSQQAYTTLNGQFPRLSDRFSVDDLQIDVSVPNTRKLFGKKTANVQMQVIDLSISGALVVGPHLDSVRAGSRVKFVHDGAEGSAEIRHVRPTQDMPGMTNAAYYGIVFLNLSEDLKEIVYQRMAERRGKKDPELNHLWNHSR